MPSARPAVTTFALAVDPNHNVTARLYHASATAHQHRATLVLAHGAGAGQTSRFMVDFASSLALRGIDAVTFNFPYTESGRRLPDGNMVLEATWRAVLRRVQEMPELTGRRLFAGGKSMGGRIVSQVAATRGVAEGGDPTPPLSGLVFLGYPLHPPGRPGERRDKHLPAVTCPMLFVQGERDTFGKADEMRELVAHLPLAELYVVPGGNHSLEPPKRAVPSLPEVMAAVEHRVAEWIRART